MYYVQVLKYKRGKDDKLVEEFGPHSYRTADIIEDGLNINLNHEEYYTRIIEKENA